MESKQIKALIIVVVVIFAGIGAIFLFMMIGNMLEFAEELEQLKQQLQYWYPFTWEQIWYSPEVQNAIREEFMMLFGDKAVIFMPLFLIALIVGIAGKKYAEKQVIIEAGKQVTIEAEKQVTIEAEKQVTIEAEKQVIE